MNTPYLGKRFIVYCAPCDKMLVRTDFRLQAQQVAQSHEVCGHEVLVTDRKAVTS